MTLPAAPQSISLSQIQAEYGGSASTSLSEYYRGGGLVSAESGVGTIPMNQRVMSGTVQAPESDPQMPNTIEQVSVSGVWAAVGNASGVVQVYQQGVRMMGVSAGDPITTIWGLRVAVTHNYNGSQPMLAISAGQAVAVYLLDSGYMPYVISLRDQSNAISFLGWLNNTVVCGMGTSGNITHIEGRSAVSDHVAFSLTLPYASLNSGRGQMLIAGSYMVTWGIVNNSWLGVVYNSSGTQLHAFGITGGTRVAATASHICTWDSGNNYVTIRNIGDGYGLRLITLQSLVAGDSVQNITAGTDTGLVAVQIYNYNRQSSRVDAYRISDGAYYWTFPTNALLGTICVPATAHDMLVLSLSGTMQLVRVSYPYPQISISHFAGTSQVPAHIEPLGDELVVQPTLGWSPNDSLSDRTGIRFNFSGSISPNGDGIGPTSWATGVYDLGKFFEMRVYVFSDPVNFNGVDVQPFTYSPWYSVTNSGLLLSRLGTVSSGYVYIRNKFTGAGISNSFSLWG